MTAIFEACWYISRRILIDFASPSVKFLGCMVAFLVPCIHQRIVQHVLLILIDLTLMNACSVLLGKILTIPRGTGVCSVMGAMNQHESFLPTIMRSQKWELWDLKGTLCNVQSHQLIFAIFKTSAPQRYTSTKLFKTLRPLQREVQRDPPKKGRRIVFQSDLNLIAVEGFPLNWQCLWGMSPVSTSQRPKKHAVASFMPIISWCQNWTLLHQSKCLEFIRWLR